MYRWAIAILSQVIGFWALLSIFISEHLPFNQFYGSCFLLCFYSLEESAALIALNKMHYVTDNKQNVFCLVVNSETATLHTLYCSKVLFVYAECNSIRCSLFQLQLLKITIQTHILASSFSYLRIENVNAHCKYCCKNKNDAFKSYIYTYI